jgi:ligand-binding sensor domain-containing protein/signal transduction histidine kinase
MIPKLLLRNLNTFRNSNFERQWFFRSLLAGVLAVCFAGATPALNPNRTVSDYVHDRWGVEQGLLGAPVYAIAQTPDGYLWFGTENGLVRFDGLSFQLFSQTNSAAFPTGPVLELMTDGEGNLWLRPQSRNLFRYRDGILQDVTSDLDSSRSGVTAMCLGPNGEALFAVRLNGAFVYNHGKFEQLLSTAAPTKPTNMLVISMAKTSDGKVWMGTRDTGLFYVYEGRLSSVEKGLPDRKINSLTVGNDRELWIGTDNGIVRWNRDQPIKTAASNIPGHAKILAITRDRDSNIWIGTDKGLVRVNSGQVSSLETANNSFAGPVNAIFEDREGNLWIGSAQGVERLRDIAFAPYVVQTGRSQGVCTVYIDDEGRKWFAPSDGGLYWEKDGKTGQVTQDGLDHDVVYSLDGSKGDLWIGRRQGGLTHLRSNNGSFAAKTYTQASGLAQNSIYAVRRSRDGTLWAGSVSGGVTRLKDGKFTSYRLADGLPSDTITSILESSDGRMWFGTANGMSSLFRNNLTPYGSFDGLPPGKVNCLLEDTKGTIWIGTDNGIAGLSSGEIQVPYQVPEALNEPILGIAEDSNGWLWISTSNHVLRVNRDKLLEGQIGEEDIREFGLTDGLRSIEGVRRHRSVITDASGRIWISTGRGLSVVDPSQVSNKSVAALVHIEGVSADGRAVDMQSAVHISSAHQRITFSYAGLSLTVPERVRFRYRLDGFDQDWSAVVSTREAAYTNLRPAAYRFRVIASNSEGLWNGPESVFEFDIEPVFWQTGLFRLTCVIAAGIAVLIFYRLRLRRFARQLNMRFEERLAERTRVAQDLHDTLLQGFLSASMQLDVAADHLPADSAAKPLISRVHELMRHVIEEGRTALKGLRSPGSESYNLAESFAAIQQEMGIRQQVDFQVTVEGTLRPLHPVIRDEVYRIGREALVNAFRHSQASSIHMILEYGSKRLRIHVRDDGCGIDASFLRSGREGHFGLSGMRERSEEIGASLKVMSRAGGGTDVELDVPGSIAFEHQSSEQQPGWFAKLNSWKTRPGGRRSKGKSE